MTTIITAVLVVTVTVSIGRRCGNPRSGTIRSPAPRFGALSASADAPLPSWTVVLGAVVGGVVVRAVVLVRRRQSTRRHILLRQGRYVAVVKGEAVGGPILVVSVVGIYMYVPSTSTLASAGASSL